MIKEPINNSFTVAFGFKNLRYIRSEMDVSKQAGEAHLMFVLI
jgi:hypothetical protein